MYITIHDPLISESYKVEVNLKGINFLILENQNLEKENEILKQKIKSLESQLEEMTQRYLYR